VTLAARIREVQMVVQRALTALDDIVQRLEITEERGDNGSGSH
jgi:hypothetical protein